MSVPVPARLSIRSSPRTSQINHSEPSLPLPIPPENREIPVPLHVQATRGTDFVSTRTCQKFLRNVMLIVFFQFAAISAFLLLVMTQPLLHEKIGLHDNAVIVSTVSGATYLMWALVVIGFNKAFRKTGVINYFPLIWISGSIALLLGLIAVQFPETIAVTTAISLYALVMVLSQVLFNWELSLPSGVFSTTLANTVFGPVILATMRYTDFYQISAEAYFLVHIVIVGVIAYMLYDLELMTTVAGVHKYLRYGIVYNSAPYAALHLTVDYINAIGSAPFYLYYLCSKRCRTCLHTLVPRSCLGMSCGKIHEHGDFESEPDDDPAEV